MNEPLDFNTNLPAVDTSRPVPQEGSYICDVTNVEPVKTGAGQPMWKVTLTFTGSAQSLPNSRGEVTTINPGYMLFENILMYQPENPNAPDYTVRVAKFYDACMGTDDSTRPETYGDLRPCIGKKIIVKVKPEEDKKGEYGIQARVKGFKFLQQ